MAEMAESHMLGLRQKMKINSRCTLHSAAPKLKKLKIENMQASRPEDVQLILADIPDTDAFNRHLKSMIFNPDTGLFAEWRYSDSSEQMTRIGHMARCLRAARLSPKAVRE